ncbi:helix-turn-helix transcriptional regulator [Minwuia sp.]|uniref:helix-turn-helix transcriptional regulator n=1 Tax=Minwuia sp. TaxID=2493630 RepID=UPI003A9471BC
MSKATEQSLDLLAEAIRSARKRRRWSESELAERLGVSRQTVQRIEKASPRCAIGTVFEAAVLLDVPLLGDEQARLDMQLRISRDKLAAARRHVDRLTQGFDDDF